MSIAAAISKLRKRTQQANSARRGAVNSALGQYEGIVTRSAQVGRAVRENFIAKRQRERDDLVRHRQDFIKSTENVLDKDTLNWLRSQSDIAAPTLTSIFAGLESARASRAARWESLVDQEERLLKLSSEEDALRMRHEMDELRDLRSTAGDIARQGITAANQEANDLIGIYDSMLRSEASDIASRRSDAASRRSDATQRYRIDNQSSGSSGSRSKYGSTEAFLRKLGGSGGAPAGDGRYSSRQSQGNPFSELINKHSRRNGLDPLLVEAVMGVESANNPNAVSNKGATGLMQTMPGTFKEMADQLKIPVAERDMKDPDQSIAAGTRYLAQQLNRYDGDVSKALAAYNAGPGAVNKYGGIPPFKETQDYVPKILGRYQKKVAAMGQQPEAATKQENALPVRKEEVPTGIPSPEPDPPKNEGYAISTDFLRGLEEKRRMEYADNTEESALLFEADGARILRNIVDSSPEDIEKSLLGYVREQAGNPDLQIDDSTLEKIQEAQSIDEIEGIAVPGLEPAIEAGRVYKRYINDGYKDFEV